MAIVNYGTITNCYNVGSVDGLTSSGGIVGKVEDSSSGAINNCYSLEGSVSGILDGDNGTVKSSIEMQATAFVDLINGSQSPAPWKADYELSSQVNNGYPILSWQ